MKNFIAARYPDAQLTIHGVAPLQREPQSFKIDFRECVARDVRLMNQDFDTVAIYEAPRAPVIEALSRTKRDGLNVPLFRRIGHQVWPPVTPPA
jgi:hypothetical protein